MEVVAINEGQSLIRMENVSTAILKNIFLHVKKGEIITLIGSSGAGKSSLLMLLNRLNDPDEGTITYRGQDVNSYDIPALRKSIGMVLQSSSLFDGTVEDNLAYGPKIFNEWDEKMGEELLQNVQLPTSYLQRPVDELSGGEQQRVAFARTLANRPDILLLDEVTSAVDLKNVELIEDFLSRIVPERVQAILMVTHDVAQARRLGNRTIFMDQGKIVEEGKTSDLFANPQTEQLQYFLKE
ncbi:ABC transporter ATP-binding protein [Natribacillus halophilus]|uniref:Phosphate ABC transporter ATP-binding protein, PhoT family n=1 Tax=Natribacillus halophilus TaxID=549003 RepID=A0A1G8J3P9_9BACI|nr:ATP-binding cassette domain-containing protein [Natribacillus halophilus]SDI25869.1 phosphate ABC transporter ATP-binding protein, PhoT family [Natribacillus halophilus]